jgi:hypothetical protein
MNRNLRQNHRLSKTIGRETNYRGREKRKLFDTHVEDGKDLWDASRNLGQMHPSASDPNSLASHMVNSLVTVPDSIPNNAFKHGAFPHRYTTMSIMDYPEPDTQPIRPDLSPLEFIGLRTMEHMVPGDQMCKLSQYPTTFAQGMDARMMGKTPTKTMDAVPMSARQSVPYQSNFQTTSSIATMKDSRTNINLNKGIMVGANPYKPGMAGSQAAVDRAFPVVRPRPEAQPAAETGVATPQQATPQVPGPKKPGPPLKKPKPPTKLPKEITDPFAKILPKNTSPLEPSDTSSLEPGGMHDLDGDEDHKALDTVIVQMKGDLTATIALFFSKAKRNNMSYAQIRTIARIALDNDMFGDDIVKWLKGNEPYPF